MEQSLGQWIGESFCADQWNNSDKNFVMAKIYNITADSIPDLDEWGWDDYWALTDWIKWHQQMVLKYGKVTANKKFLDYWGKQTLGASSLESFAYNSNFTNYIEKEKLADGVWAHPYAPPGILRTQIKVVTAATDIVGSAASAASSVGAAVANAGKIMKVALPLTLAATFIIGGIWAYKKYAT